MILSAYRSYYYLYVFQALLIFLKIKRLILPFIFLIKGKYFEEKSNWSLILASKVIIWDPI